jgi:PXPV repeat (3 copies)
MNRRGVAVVLLGALMTTACATIPPCLDPAACTAEEIATQQAARAQNAATAGAVAAGLGAVAAGAAAGAAAAATAPPPVYVVPAPVYVAPRPVYVVPRPVCRTTYRGGVRCW